MNASEKVKAFCVAAGRVRTAIESLRQAALVLRDAREHATADDIELMIRNGSTQPDEDLYALAEHLQDRADELASKDRNSEEAPTDGE